MATSEAKRRLPAGTGSAPHDSGQQDYLTASAPKQAYKRPQHEPTERRRSRAYVEGFRKRIPLGRAIRLMCGSCMGGEVDQMPRGEVAQAIDECGSCTCPLWPFRFGNDPWRPELSEAKLAAVQRAGEKARRCLEAQRRTSAESATGDLGGTVSPPRAGDHLMAWKTRRRSGQGGAVTDRLGEAGVRDLVAATRAASTKFVLGTHAERRCSRSSPNWPATR